MAAFYQVDSEDAAFLFSERTDNPAHLSLVALYDQSALGDEVVRFQHIVQLVKKHLPLAPVLRQKLKRVPANLDYPYWTDDRDFDIDYHLRHLALPMPGDWRQFCIQVSRLHSRNLDTRRPLWELYIIEGLNKVNDLPAGSFALYLKVHHSAMDEHSAREWLHSLHGHKPNPRQHEESIGGLRVVPAEEPGTLSMGVKAVTGNSMRLLRMAAKPRVLYRGISREMAHWSLRRVRQLASSDDPPSSESGHFSRKPGPRRVFDGFSLDASKLDSVLAGLSRLRMQHVMVVACTEATRRYLLDTEGRETSGILAKVQAETGNAAAHARTGHQLAAFSYDGYVHLADLQQRLAAIANSVVELDDHEAELWGSRLRARYENLPAALCAVLSNLPASGTGEPDEGETIGIALGQAGTEAAYLQGAACVGMTCLNHLPPACGLVFSVTSYCRSHFISFTSEHDMLRDPVALKRHLQEVIKELAELL